MTGTSRWLIGLLALMVIGAGCTREQADARRYTLDDPIILRVDTRCVHVPNVFTPNGDGINDKLSPVGSNAAALRFEVRTMNDELVHASTEPFNNAWDGTMNGTPLPNGPYRVRLEVHTWDNRWLRTEATVFKAGDPLNTCLTNDVAPFMRDMIDPRLCGAIYPGNDRFCE